MERLIAWWNEKDTDSKSAAVVFGVLGLAVLIGGGIASWNAYLDATWIDRGKAAKVSCFREVDVSPCGAARSPKRCEEAVMEGCMDDAGFYLYDGRALGRGYSDASWLPKH